MVNQQIYKEARNRVSEPTERAKTEFYNDKIIKCGGDERNHLRHHRSIDLLTNVSNQNMAQAFSALFRDKIVNIRTGLESGLINDR